MHIRQVTFTFTKVVLQSCIYMLEIRGEIMVDKFSQTPYYLQIYMVLKDRIDTGMYKENAMLPSENELVKEFEVTRLTIRNSIKKLKDEGRIYTLKGKGSFVNSAKIEHSLFKFYSFGRDYTNSGIETQTEVIQAFIENADEEICQKLSLDKDEKVNSIIRIRKLDKIPLIVETSYTPCKLAPAIIEEHLEKLSIYDLLENKFNLKIVNAKEYLDPNIAGPYYSKLLGVKRNTPVFVTERITYTNDRIPIEYRVSIIRSDRFRFSVDLR
jgi:GntR family transcriptional regulator